MLQKVFRGQECHLGRTLRCWKEVLGTRKENTTDALQIAGIEQSVGVCSGAESTGPSHPLPLTNILTRKGAHANLPTVAFLTYRSPPPPNSCLTTVHDPNCMRLPYLCARPLPRPFPLWVRLPALPFCPLPGGT